LFTNNILNEEQMKQIEENSNKQITTSIFNYNKSPIKNNDSLLGIKTNNSPLDNLPNISNFRNDTKIINKLSQPNINFNINNSGDKNKFNIDYVNMFNNSVNSSKIVDLNQKFESNNVNIINNNKVENPNNTITFPKYPSFFSQNNENLNNLKNENIINNISNSIKKIENIFGKNSFIANNPYNNFLSDYQSSIGRALGQFSTFPSFNNNCFINPINNTFNHIFTFNPNNFTDSSNIKNYNKKENNNIFITKKNES
jgi:hypothetical protein